MHAVGDFFNERRLCEIALETLATEFDSKIGPMHMKPEPVDWLSELFEAIDLVYRDIPFGDPSPQSAPQSSVRAAFVQFVHTARYVLLQTDEFSRFLDAAPTFALDLFRAMRASADFVCTNVTNAFCSLCGNRPTRGEKKYYTHIGPEKLHLRATCSNCATKKDLPSGLEDWMGKKDSAASNLGKRES